MEDKIRRPYVPEATVRLLINYNKSHKTVLRVNPQLPLESLLPLVCHKCELSVETTVLLRDCRSKESLDIAKTLNEHGLREVFAWDTADTEPPVDQYQLCSQEPAKWSALHHLDQSTGKKKQDVSGFLSFCRRLKKKTEIKEGMVRSPTTPDLLKIKSADVNEQEISHSNTLPGHQKRRAPLPPMGVSQCLSNNLNNHRGSQRSVTSNLRRPKRNAPPPPCTSTLKEVQVDIDAEGDGARWR
ncbi:cordon-bleu protein-like 1 isoform X2 [Corythoichthys intestinalis]|uniref:cordon-bleu protein-like 1 isoform X2 n=1 Tax=Corythoichthys intestinalis TaxID=161448 RepID=UPI0025A623B6|nr:cordon-bleu protein-like 1 isoform X2 [Corythoichthys intestinalis]